MSRPKALSVIAASVASLLLMSAGASALPRSYRARHALRYIVRHQADNGSIVAFSPVGSTADAVLAMASARRGPFQMNRALHYLGHHVAEANSIGLKAKVIIAAVAGGQHPRHFGGTNLVRKIKRSERPNGHYGKDRSVIDQALAILALAAAPRAHPAHRAAIWLAHAQCPDGGWQFDAPYDPGSDSRHCHDRAGGDFSRSDTNTTAYAEQAIAVSLAMPPPLKASPFAYFRSLRDPIKHGWGYDQNNTLTDANSTALVLQAYAAAGIHHPRQAMRALRKLQYRSACGKHFPFAFAFSWTKSRAGGLKRTGPDIGATIGAALGLLKQPLPVPASNVVKRIPRRVRCHS
jgi:hypothetical protein